MLAAALALSGCAGAGVIWRGRSPDRRRRVEVIKAGQRQRVRLDGAAGKPYLGVGVGALVFSPDSRKLAYPAQRSDGSWVVVLDGEEGAPFDGVGEIVFGPRSRRLAYLARRGERWQVVLDGRVSYSAEAIFKKTLRFSPGGRRLAWVAAQGLRARAVLDGRAGPLHDAVAGLAFSPDGARWGYAARDHGRWRAVVGGRAGPPHDFVAGLILGRGGRRAYAAQDGEVARVVLNGRPGPPHRAVRASSLAFTRAGALLYVAREAGGLKVVGAGPGPLYEAIVGPQLSADGRRWGYIGRRGKQQQVVIDGAVRGTHRRAGDLIFSADGRRWAYLARSAAGVEVVHDRGRQRFDVVLAGSLAFSPDGAHLACLAGDRAKRELFFAVDGARRKGFDLEELKAAVKRRGRRPGLLRRWVAAELAAATRRPKR